MSNGMKQALPTEATHMLIFTVDNTSAESWTYNSCQRSEFTYAFSMCGARLTL